MSSEVNATTITATATKIFFQPEFLNFFYTFNLLICGELIAILGIVGNIITILSFSKEGFQDSLNITLIAFAVSDIGALFSQMLVNIVFCPFWKSVDLSRDSSLLIFSSIFFYPRGYFVRVSGLITLFAMFERCLCVLLPLKVKSIITRSVALTVNCFIFLALLFYIVLPHIFVYGDWSFDPKQKKTRIVIYYTNNSEPILQVTYWVANLFIPHSTFVFLILCNMIIVLKLKSNAKWRHTVTGNKALSRKERRLGVMLTNVSTIFIVCLTPQSAMLTALAIVRELKMSGPYFNVSLLVYSFTFLLETVNCSANILVYYTMSTKFRERLQLWFPFLRPKSEQ